MRWQVGSVTVTRIVELELAGGTRFILPDATPDAVRPFRWLRPHFVNQAGKLVMSIHALVIDTGRRRVLVDTCLGNDKRRRIPLWNMRRGSFLADLAAAGYPRETIDTVVCTHLHVDHVGWNTMLVDGRWTPTFPNARYLIGRREWDHWRAEADADTADDVIGDSVRPIFDAGLADLVDTDHQVTDEVRLRPTIGHTPGHVSVQIVSGGERALITGDFIHHPCQMARPDWNSSADVDADQACRTRHRLLDECADTPVLMIGTHFPAPTAGLVVRDGESYRLDVG